MSDHASGQPLPEWVVWYCCNQVHSNGTPCTGAAQANYGRCLAHLHGTQLVSVMTRQAGEAPPDLDARGVRLTSNDLERYLAAARSEDGLLRLGSVSLDRATVEGNVSLDGATVKGRVFLSGATVEGYAFLHHATVEGDVLLYAATVEGGVSLDEATVERGVFLSGATVKGRVSLHHATVEGHVSLYWTKVEGDVSLDGATVKATSPSMTRRSKATSPSFERRSKGKLRWARCRQRRSG